MYFNKTKVSLSVCTSDKPITDFITFFTDAKLLDIAKANVTISG